jgi:hypothetical protein
MHAKRHDFDAHPRFVILGSITPNDAIPVQVLQPPLRARARCHLTLNHVSIATTI